MGLDVMNTANHYLIEQLGGHEKKGVDQVR